MTVKELPTIEVITVPESTGVDMTKADRAEAEAAEIQAMSEDVPTGREFEFMGKKFRLADKVGLMPLMRFAHMASSGMNTDDDYMAAMSAIYEMIRDVIHEPQWMEFQQHATATKAGEEDLLAVVHRAIEIMTARPTKSDSDSSPSASPSTRPSTVTRSQRAAELGLVPVADLAG